MIFKVLCAQQNGEVRADRFETQHLLSNPRHIADRIRQLYEGSDVEVIGVVRVSEVDIDIH